MVHLFCHPRALLPTPVFIGRHRSYPLRKSETLVLILLLSPLGGGNLSLENPLLSPSPFKTRKERKGISATERISLK